MTRKQTLTVVLLAILDLAVIAGLGASAWARNKPAAMQQAAPETVQLPSDCAAFLLDSATRAGWTARVSATDSELLYEVSMGAPLDLPADSQAIWAVLDNLSPEFPIRCGIPDMVTIIVVVRADGTATRQQVAAQFAGDALVNWIQGLTSDGDLASSARFRSVTERSP